ncbi:MAG: VOC family protein [Candidatus Merdivicinus sp.]|jgi:glyoxylase I family protein
MENQKIKHAGFHHLALISSNFEKSLQFYIEGLGCTYVRGWGEGTKRIAMVDFGSGHMLEIFARGTGEEQQEPRFLHLAIATPDPDGAYETALKAGAEPVDPPKDVVIQSETPFPVRIAFVKGPDGEILEFFCDKEYWAQNA